MAPVCNNTLWIIQQEYTNVHFVSIHHGIISHLFTNVQFAKANK